MLKNVSITDNSGAQGDATMKSDPFQDLFDKLRAEINEMIDKNASVILSLPKVKGHNTYKLNEEGKQLVWINWYRAQATLAQGKLATKAGHQRNA